MIRILSFIGIGLAVLIGAVLIYATTKPNTFQVARTASIKATPEKIFPLINDFQLFRSWSPYETKDPAMKRSFSGPSSGQGATYAWEGNGNVGSGQMKITDSQPSSRVTIALDMMRPLETHNTVEFTLVPKGNATDVTWTMQGPVPYIAKIIHVFFNMDRMVGDDFETGLVSLKVAAEG